MFLLASALPRLYPAGACPVYATWNGSGTFAWVRRYQPGFHGSLCTQPCTLAAPAWCVQVLAVKTTAMAAMEEEDILAAFGTEPTEQA